MSAYKVFIHACPDYNPDRIAGLISKTVKSLRLSIKGKIVIKPNLVMAHPKVATESYTHSEVIEGIIKAVLNNGSDIKHIDIVEKSGLGITTATAFRHAGYRPLKKKYGVGLYPLKKLKGMLLNLNYKPRQRV